MITARQEPSSSSLGQCAAVVLIYVGFVVLINTLFVYLPVSHFYGHEFTYADFAVGGIYVVRDLAQRIIGHKVIFAMILAAILTYLLADAEIAMASLSAFAIGEVVDWSIYTYTKKPLSQRILLSSCISSPVDSAIFLGMIHRLAPFEFCLMTAIKILGAIAVWGLNKQARNRTVFSRI